MNEQIKWRFPRGNYSKKRGISSSEFETFKKDPFKSLAREILQNSIDAIDSDEEPVRVEFNEFEVNREDVPGIDDFEEELKNCLSSWKGDSNCEVVYQNMLEEIRKDRIRCLRISDFNTTGLKGIERSSIDNNQFLALTKGTGISKKKPGISGGSKGVGKYAAYGTSRFSLIFYSTKTTEGYTGSIGVAELVSSEIQDNSTIKDWTQGIGFYSINDYNEPNTLMLDLDPSFKRTECGTDIFIIGFKSAENWEKFTEKKSLVESLISYAHEQSVKISEIETLLKSRNLPPMQQGRKLYALVARNEFSFAELIEALPKVRRFVESNHITPEVIEQAEIQIKYKGYIEREKLLAEKLHRLENIAIPAGFDFMAMNALTIEARQKLSKIRPETIGQASRIPGVSPADINVMLIKFGR